MQKYKVRNAGEALAYITDCTLATVCDLASKKSTRNRGEYKRQVSIAQTAIDWMKELGVEYSTTRAAEVGMAGSVEEWAKKFMV